MGTRFWIPSALIMQCFLLSLIRTITVLGLFLLGQATPANAHEQTLLVLGDSISAAYGMSLEEGWVAHLERQIEHSHPQVEVVNASISGETTGGALRRLPGLLEQHSPQVVLIELGGNDGLRGFPIRSFRDNLSALAGQSIEAGARVVILPMEIPPNYGTRYTSGFRESYPLVAEKKDAILGPFILDGIATDPALMQPDGIHPKPEAQETMMRNVLPAIEAALR
jgi:acyl-CoA thioesterase-1